MAARSRLKVTPLFRDQLRAAIAADSRTPYGLARESGVDERVIRRFLARERDVMAETVERLLVVLGLQLRR